MLCNGIVKWFDFVKGYGFVVNDETLADVFVHWKQVPGKPGHRNLQEGDHVVYEQEDGERGPRVKQIVEIRRH